MPIPISFSDSSFVLMASKDSMKIDSVISSSRYSGGRPVSCRIPSTISVKSSSISWITEIFTET
ncbi:hypothetical protein D3C80_1832400 [compost metagenome]